MKKNSLKTILEDFFSWKHVLIWIIVLLLTGVGVAWGTGGVTTGYRLNSGDSNRKLTTLTGGVIVSNNSTFDYFVPTKTTIPEFRAFVQNCPSMVTVHPTCAAGTYYDSSQQCTNTCLTCPANYYCTGDGYKVACSSGEISPAGSTSFIDCQIGCGNPVQICQAGHYCDRSIDPAGVCVLDQGGCATPCPTGLTCFTCASGYYCSTVTNPRGVCLPNGTY